MCDSGNRPRNLMVLDATSPLDFGFSDRFGTRRTITVHQSADDDTWPGGACWDLGWCMAQWLVGFEHEPKETITSTGTGSNKPLQRKICLVGDAGTPERLVPKHIETIVELGCGVGLTGLVAAQLFKPKLTLLTDLNVVVEKIAHPNVVANSEASKNGARTLHKGTSRVAAVPLCWGNRKDEAVVKRLLLEASCSASSGNSSSRRRKKKTQNEKASSIASRSAPDLLLIGDVAYQHEPGAPSHFDPLMETVLELADSQTLVVFGLRIRMPASVDLLDMFYESFDEIHSLSADSINHVDFSLKSHTMSVHFLRRKAPPSSST